MNEYDEMNKRKEMNKLQIVFICPKCGKWCVCNIKTWDECCKANIEFPEKCEYCQSKIVSTGVNFFGDGDGDFFDISCDGTALEKDRLLQPLYRKYVYPSPEFNEELFKARQRDDDVENREWDENNSREQTQSTTVSCPRCNSTQIQMVQRKWSLLTGFLTNKVDRVCVNCKHKF